MFSPFDPFNHMHENRLSQFTELFAALSDKTRLRMLGLMANGEVSVGYLSDATGESQPKVSRHLAYLRDCGIVKTRRDGKWIYYAINEPDDHGMANVLAAAINAFGSAANSIRPGQVSPGIDHNADQSGNDVAYAEADMGRERPADLDVFLL
jgi:DNA-binding transcriptional ArsR family regulator